MYSHHIALSTRVSFPCESDMPWHRLNNQLCYLLIEVHLIVIIISLFLIGYTDATRKALWEEGGQHGFESDPKMRIYFYANYLQPPEIPFIWSRRYTEFNLASGIFTLCLFLTRQLLALATSTSMQTNIYLLSCVLLFWVMSCISQRSPDYSDPDYSSRVPWYLNHSCSIASTQNRAALGYVSWVLILVSYVVLDSSVITRCWASKLFPDHLASQFGV
ncbi:uncharacterized protein EAE97_002938 [Botrytis byssoidea]|uniref:Uncharacterized protein n=1 Tax=Botrytis byssoidea TaxID=139641 RepID=A0A9P5M1N3_9HELO|nr:uncharacterized protein EAE97_002938 [Botrytis byssoidea]KAF7949429.1 hypothetical protein EAE97_002938 [Botrytis byssoidea]